MGEAVRTERRPDGVTVVTLNRPDEGNAASYGFIEELLATLESIGANPHSRVVILTGAGDSFCIGIDPNGYGVDPEVLGQGPVQRGMLTGEHLAEVVFLLREMRQPVIAAVNGPALGVGFAFACGADIRYAARSASFGTEFVNSGIAGTDLGLSWMLPRMIGTSRSWELLLTGRRVDADEADRLGIVSGVVADNQLLDTAIAVATEIAANSPLAVWLSKETNRATAEIAGLRAAVGLENRTQVLTAQTADARLASQPGVTDQTWQNR